MKIMNLTEESSVYTSNAYLVLGTWNALTDVNTLVDVGRDPAVIEKINAASTGVGKRRVEQIVLTHSHYDHVGNLHAVSSIFKPKVCAFSKHLDGVDHVLCNGEIIKMGDRMFKVFHAPGHSSDSICLFCREEGILFTGDVPVSIHSKGNHYDERFIGVMRELSGENIHAIYTGHGKPIEHKCNNVIKNTYENIKGRHCSSDSCVNRPDKQ